MQRMSVLVPLVTVIILLGSATSYAQLGDTSQLTDTSNILPTPTLVNGVLTIGTTVLQPDDASTQEELPGLGHKFELFGTMVKDVDPENAAGNPGHSGGGAGGNEVISSTSTPGSFGLAYRKLGSGIQIRALTNQINLKYHFEAPRTCNAGSPRVSLLIDGDGDGDTDFAAHGHVFPPAYSGCLMNRWAIEDLTDEERRWEVTPGGVVPGVPVFPFTPWDAFVPLVEAAFPNHKVVAGFLVEDSCFAAGALGCGKAYYDLLTIENRTLEIWQDAVRK